MVMSCKSYCLHFWTDMRHASHSRDKWSMDSGDSLKIWIVGLFTMKTMIGSRRLESSVIHCHLCILFNLYGIFWCHILVDMFSHSLSNACLLYFHKPGHHGRFRVEGHVAVLSLTCRGFVRKIIGSKWQFFWFNVIQMKIGLQKKPRRQFARTHETIQSFLEVSTWNAVFLSKNHPFDNGKFNMKYWGRFEEGVSSNVLQLLG